jgi:hypothetical protein
MKLWHSLEAVSDCFININMVLKKGSLNQLVVGSIPTRPSIQ